ncbi:MAG: FAD binding domain-containing protein [Solirubrobacterales bacterium]|nr:FAD binding domain-containing protein [Solirubrobacterales bacterium]
MRASDTEVLTPGSAAQAVEAFGDGRGITVFAGGTILMPEIAAGRYPRGGRTLMLDRAGLDQLDQLGGDGTVAIGAMVPLSKLAGSRIEPLAAAAREVGDLEIRAQATIGGNLCAPPAAESPRGDLQAALLAMGARVRSAGKAGERTESVEDFLARSEDETRLVLAIEVDKPRRASYLSLRRPHAHSYAAMTVACAQNDGNGGVRVAAGGVAPRAKRLHGVERALAEGASGEDAAARALDEVDPQDDALASAWYRRNVLPTLITRALEQLQGG